MFGRGKGVPAFSPTESPPTSDIGWLGCGRHFKFSCLNRLLEPQWRMDFETFRASRWTGGNHLFPTVIEVTDRAVIRHKRSFFSKDEISISISKITSVHIKTGICWSDILIESSGGSDPLASHGHSKADACRIRELVEQAQGITAVPEKLKLP
jgi:hypothetical protein